MRPPIILKHSSINELAVEQLTEESKADFFGAMPLMQIFLLKYSEKYTIILQARQCRALRAFARTDERTTR